MPGSGHEPPGECPREGEAAAIPRTIWRSIYILMTDPGVYHYGTMVAVHGAAEPHEEHGNMVPIRVQPDEQIPNPPPGATVTADVHCGTAPLVWTLLHEAWEWLRSQRDVLASRRARFVAPMTPPPRTNAVMRLTTSSSPMPTEPCHEIAPSAAPGRRGLALAQCPVGHGQARTRTIEIEVENALVTLIDDVKVPGHGSWA